MLTEDKFIDNVFKEYKNRLLEALSEVEVLDSHGNLLISPDLKVKHKESGYEYTVDQVAKDEENVVITLRSPETPRFTGPGSEEVFGATPVDSPDSEILDEQDPNLSKKEKPPIEIEVDANLQTPGGEKEEILFIVNKEDFEKEYEVQ